MNKQELVRNEMVKAMKEKDKPKKRNTFSFVGSIKECGN